MTKTKKKSATAKPPKPPGRSKNRSCVGGRSRPPQSERTLTPIDVPAPNQAATPYPYKISGTTPPPAVLCSRHPEFPASMPQQPPCAGQRISWAKIVPAGTKWQIGNTRCPSPSIPVSI